MSYALHSSVGECPLPYTQAIPGELSTLCVTGSEAQMALHFPNESSMMHEWLGTNGGRIVVERLVEGQPHYGDETWRQGVIVAPDGNITNRFEYRAEVPGRVSEAFFKALGWLVGEKLQARGFLAGRIQTLPH